MVSSVSHMVPLLLIASLVIVQGRPQNPLSTNFDVGEPTPGPVAVEIETGVSHGSFIGEILAFTGKINVVPAQKKPRGDKKPKPERVEEGDEPRFSRFIGGPVAEVSVGSNAGVPLGVAASGPEISISGSAITFHRPAQVVPISS